jgi:hypothetical protein
MTKSEKEEIQKNKKKTSTERTVQTDIPEDCSKTMNWITVKIAGILEAKKDCST